MNCEWIKGWLYNQEILGTIVGFFLTVILIQFIFPHFSKKRKIALEKLNNFYNVAYMFVLIRKDFSVIINNNTHDKHNCGFFHEFNISSGEKTQSIDTDSGNVILSTVSKTKTTLILDEMAFFDYFTKHIQFVDVDLKDTFIKYMRRRFVDTINQKLNCTDKQLVRLRKKIEDLILEDYASYSKLAK